MEKEKREKDRGYDIFEDKGLSSIMNSSTKTKRSLVKGKEKKDGGVEGRG